MADRTCNTCPAEITEREERLNAGLCDECLPKALAAAAREIARDQPRRITDG